MLHAVKPFSSWPTLIEQNKIVKVAVLWELDTTENFLNHIEIIVKVNKKYDLCGIY